MLGADVTISALMKLVRQAIRGLAACICIVAVALALTELFFRMTKNKFDALDTLPTKYTSRVFKAKLRARIQSFSHDGFDARPNPYTAPLEVFSNVGFDNPDRMKEIAAKDRLPAGETWVVPNFLRNPAEAKATLFRVTTNSLGFRSPEYRKEKKPHTYRLVLLGAYTAFGHGVNDDETYAFLIEKALNREKLFGLRFEVWNGGRQASTAIMGLARLQKEIAEYSPDLLLWDYGLVDKHLYGDHFDVTSEKSPVHRMIPREITQSMNPCQNKYYEGTEICYRWRRWHNGIMAKKLTAGWHESNRRMIEFVKERRIPALIISHGASMMPWNEYSPLADEERNIYVVDTRPAVTSDKIRPIDEERFWSSPNWLNEIGVTRDLVGPNPEVLFRTDALMYNARAHELIAELLTAEIKKILNKTSNPARATFFVEYHDSH